MNILIALLILTAAPEDLYVTKSPAGGVIYITCEYMERQTIRGVYRVYRDGDALVVVKRDGNKVTFVWGNIISMGEIDDTGSREVE